MLRQPHFKILVAINKYYDTNIVPMQESGMKKWHYTVLV